MAVVTTKSASIINWDGNPIFIPSSGEGAPGRITGITSNLTGVVGDSIGSVYKLVRFPTNAKVKRLWVAQFGATGTSAGDIDVAFSDSLTDGTQAVFNSLANPVVQVTGPVDNKLFGSAVTLNGAAAPVTATDRTFQNTFTSAHADLPMWQVLVNIGATQFVADPGGFFDIVIKLTTGVAVANINYYAELDYIIGD